MSKEQAKGAHYIGLLDEARCNSRWTEVPELVRKVGKHAPSRKCLLLTAHSEHQVISYTRGRQSSTVSSALSGLIEPLLEAIKLEEDHPEDALQGQVCVGWIHWALGEPNLAVSRLPRDVIQDIERIHGGFADASSWTKICAVKGIYLKGASLEKLDEPNSAIETFASGLPLLVRLRESLLDEPELLLWRERLLTRACFLSNEVAKKNKTASSSNVAMNFFRSWAQLWRGKSSDGLVATDGAGLDAGIPKRHVWKAYYSTLSRYLQQGLPYLPQPATTEDEETFRDDPGAKHLALKLQQRSEIELAQTTYESLLMREVRFPQANETNVEVEEWVELVMANWRILCGSSWNDEELGQGGKDGVGHGVLDILYRAAAKTFHSTPILRHLFTVHASLAEFDLAFKAFDTYMEIVQKGRARVKKSGDREVSLDNDETVIKTASEAIRILCRFGTRKEGEKAKDIGELITSLLDEIREKQNQSQANGSTGDSTHGSPYLPTPSPKGIALAHRAIAISQAHWSRLTFDATDRPNIQNRALLNFRRSLEGDLGESDNLESFFGLGLLLAEKRDVPRAIEVVKRALIPQSDQRASVASSDDGSSIDLTPEQKGFVRERRLMPLLHLLALLLSARQDFTTAAKSCDAAFEQFLEPANLFGRNNVSEPYRSEHLRRSPLATMDEKHSLKSKGVVDDMQTYEKFSVLQIKMTQIALIEVSEGPDAAINASNELLGLYARLFGDPKVENGMTLVLPTQSQPPKSSAGTIRSIGGSIFGRSKSLRKGLHKSEGSATSAYTGDTAVPNRPQSGTSLPVTPAPIIQVIDESGATAESQPHSRSPHHLFHHDSKRQGEKLHKRNLSLREQKSFGSLRRSKEPKNRAVSGPLLSTTPTSFPASSTRTDRMSDRPSSQESGHLEGYSPSPSQVGLAVSPDIPSPAPSPKPSQSHLRSTSQRFASPLGYMHRNQQTPVPDRLSQPPAQSSTLPYGYLLSLSLPPEPRFSLEQDRCQRITILIKVWLLIAGLYRRASLYDDAEGAIEEASKLVESLELDVVRDQTGLRRLDEACWGNRKSVAELWADISTERGHLCQAQTLPYDALSHYESALSHFPDHPTGTVGLCTLLLDISSQTISATPPDPYSSPDITATPQTSSNTPTPGSILHDTKSSHPLSASGKNIPSTPLAPLGLPDPQVMEFPSGQKRRKPTSTLERLAARDRAYGLLSSLTKLGTGWDYSEAWFALARAYEEGGQLGKAKEVLWWCVELEDSRPIRSWREVAQGSFVL